MTDSERLKVLYETLPTFLRFRYGGDFKEFCEGLDHVAKQHPFLLQQSYFWNGEEHKVARELSLDNQRAVAYIAPSQTSTKLKR